MQRLYKLVSLLVIMSLLLISNGVSLMAGENSDYSVKTRVMDNNYEIYELVINEQVVLRYRSMSQGLTATQRAAIIMERINNLGPLLVKDPIRARQINGFPIVSVGDRLLITVTRDDWEANNSTLAAVWAQNLIKAVRNSQSSIIVNETQGPSEDEVPTGADIIEPVAASLEETAMLELINKERSQLKLAPLILDGRLVAIARLKSQCIIENNYFSHISPTYGDPMTMLKSFGIKYSWAGENLAGNQTMEMAFQALMDSLQHRKNILNPNYTHIGIGIITGGPYGKVFTQLFIGNNT